MFLSVAPAELLRVQPHAEARHIAVSEALPYDYSMSDNRNADRRSLPDRAPKVGELVQVRSRRWLVDEIVETEIPGQTPLVRLACADDDAQEQALEVFWSYEPDRWILEEEGWSDLAARGFDPPRHFGAFLHTLRWNCVTATEANLFQAPFRAGIKIDAYQMEPLRKALLLPRVNLFIADDTGLGKTIEAGLIARELLLRKKCKTLVVAVPPSVLDQWRAELEERRDRPPAPATVTHTLRVAKEPKCRAR